MRSVAYLEVIFVSKSPGDLSQSFCNSCIFHKEVGPRMVTIVLFENNHVINGDVDLRAKI